jgi:hypothetical protein
MSGTYGWFLRHRVTGSFARIVDPRDGVATWEDRLRDATHFDHRKYAQDVADFIAPGAYDVLDGTIFNDPIPDANPEDLKAKSREEVQAELRRQAAEYFAKHGHKVPLRPRGYGMRPFGGAGGGRRRDADGEVDDPSLGKASELNAQTPSDTRTTSPPAPTSAEEAEAMRPFRPAFGRPTWP